MKHENTQINNNEKNSQVCDEPHYNIINNTNSFLNEMESWKVLIKLKHDMENI